MIANKTKTLLSNGKPAIGGEASSGSPWNAGDLARAGYDWVLVDTQHGLWELADIRAAVMAIAQTGATPMTRVQKNDFGLINRMLDDGMLGIVVPMVNTQEDAEAAAYAARYPPLGGRSNGPSFLATLHNDPYFEHANESVLLAVQIESVQAVENADKIMGAAGVDACWIGPSDLALSMGLTFSDIGTHPRHNEAVAHVLDVCNRLGKTPGYSCDTLETAQRRLSEGFKFVSVGEDSQFVRDGAAATLQALAESRSE